MIKFTVMDIPVPKIGIPVSLDLARDKKIMFQSQLSPISLPTTYDFPLKILFDMITVENVVKIFNSNPKIQWINGVCGHIKFNIKFFFIPYIYPRKIILSGKAHKKFWGYIQQESVSFKKSLYLKSGGLDIFKGSAGDYMLWQKFSKLTKLNTFFIKIGYFRTHSNQLSANKIDYERFTGHISSKFNINIKRLLLSLIMLPIIWLKTISTK